MQDRREDTSMLIIRNFIDRVKSSSFSCSRRTQTSQETTAAFSGCVRSHDRAYIARKQDFSLSAWKCLYHALPHFVLLSYNVDIAYNNIL